MKTISIDEKIYDIVQKHEKARPLLVDLGFTHLNDDNMFNSVARFMTLRKAAKRHNIEYEQLEEAFNTIGVTLEEGAL